MTTDVRALAERLRHLTTPDVVDHMARAANAAEGRSVVYPVTVLSDGGVQEFSDWACAFARRLLLLQADREDAAALARYALDREAECEREIDALALLPDDWDSYGSGPIGATPIDAAKRFLHAIRQKPSVVPDAGGGLQLEWHVEGWDIEVHFGDDATVSCYALPAPPRDAETEGR